MLLEPVDDARVKAFVDAFCDSANTKVATSRPQAFTDLVVAMERAERPDSLEVLTDEETVSDLREYFLTGAHLADAVAEEDLELRAQPTTVPTMLITAESVTAVTGFSNATQFAFETADGDFQAESAETFSTLFADASTVTLRKPPYSDLLAELDSQFDDEISEDFSTALQIADNEADVGLAVNPVLLGLLVAAKHELEFYDISRWGEDTGLASKATFTRMKSALEDADLIEIEAVQRDIGRPRHRLRLSERLTGKDSIGDLLTATETRVSM